MKKLNLILGILIGFTLISCSNDDEPQVSENELVGIWLRIDSYEGFEERFTFNSNQTGNIYFRDGAITDSNVLENSDDMIWATQNNILTVTANDGTGDFSASYVINSSGQLVLANDLELTYNKID